MFHYFFTLTRLDESSRENEKHLRCEVEKLLRERAVLLKEAKKHNETLQGNTLALQKEHGNIIEQKNIQIEKVRIG